MKKAIIPGTFDPITNGHLDVIKRASKMADNIVVAVAKSEKKSPLFDLDTRVEMVQQACAGLNNVEVLPFSGMLIDFAHQICADTFIKGLRVVTDFEYEFQMAVLNYNLDHDIETVFVMSPPKYMHLSSSQVRELAELGGDYTQFVPECVAKQIKRLNNL